MGELLRWWDDGDNYWILLRKTKLKSTENFFENSKIILQNNFTYDDDSVVSYVGH